MRLQKWWNNSFQQELGLHQARQPSSLSFPFCFLKTSANPHFLFTYCQKIKKNNPTFHFLPRNWTNQSPKLYLCFFFTPLTSPFLLFCFYPKIRQEKQMKLKVPLWLVNSWPLKPWNKTPPSPFLICPGANLKKSLLPYSLFLSFVTVVPKIKWPIPCSLILKAFIAQPQTRVHVAPGQKACMRTWLEVASWSWCVTWSKEATWDLD